MKASKAVSVSELWISGQQAVLLLAEAVGPEWPTMTTSKDAYRVVVSCSPYRDHRRATHFPTISIVCWTSLLEGRMLLFRGLCIMSCVCLEYYALCVFVNKKLQAKCPKRDPVDSCLEWCMDV